MINKCLNCCKWITCKEASSEKTDCKYFKFERIGVKYERNKKRKNRKR